jgi:hypothetical protein
MSASIQVCTYAEMTRISSDVKPIVTLCSNEGMNWCRNATIQGCIDSMLTYCSSSLLILVMRDVPHA